MKRIAISSWEGFQPLNLPVPKQNSGSDSSSGAGGKFKKSLREMINQAMACGALPADPRLAEPPNRPFISDLQNQDLFSNFGES